MRNSGGGRDVFSALEKLSWGEIQKEGFEMNATVKHKKIE